MTCPRDLDVLVTVHRDAFPSRGVYMAARRGLHRLAEGIDGAVSDPSAALRTQAEAGTTDSRSARDEASALSHLTGLPTLDPNVARRIRQGEATVHRRGKVVHERGE